MKYSIVHVPHPALFEVAQPVEEITDEVVDQLVQMFALMRAKNGLGLAANQIGVLRRMFVLGIGGDGPRFIINPKLVWSSRSKSEKVEGCLSDPGARVDVTRSDAVEMVFTDPDGQTQKYYAQGMIARCCQHEIDHLDGRNIRAVKGGAD